MTYRRNGEKKGFRIVKRSNQDKEKKAKKERKNVENLSFLEKLSSMLFYIVQLFFKSKQDGCQDIFTNH